MPRRCSVVFAALWFALIVPGHAAQVVATQGDNLSVDVSPADGGLAMDLLGSIWVLPPNGGVATKITETTSPAGQPRWSPDGSQILYQTHGVNENQLWLADVGSGKSRPLGRATYNYQKAAWHPAGERIVFSSWRRDSGLDLWEMDLHTGVEWRLSDAPGDETDPAWSENGRHLIYVHQDGNSWRLILRRFGEADTNLVVSDTPLSSPSWRPDGTLITFLRLTPSGPSLQMIILSEPALERQLASGEDYFLAPVSWRGRNQLFYTADGRIKKRGFGEWRSRRINFRATVGTPDPRPELTIADHELQLVTPPSGKIVIRSMRLFDGLTRDYQDNMDVLLNGGSIESVVPRRDWEDITVLDLGNTTLLPGLIDAYSSLPEGSQDRIGAQLLAYGVTTLVSTDGSTLNPEQWEGEQNPGPRILAAAPGAEPVALVSGLAGAGTPGLAALFQSRQARQFGADLAAQIRLATVPRIDVGPSLVVLGSKPNRMPAGLALHAELRALSAAGLNGDQVLKAAGQNAARMLGLGGQIGQITPGALADMLLVAGDPLVNVADTLNIVAVVRNGRFFSLVGLLDRARETNSVE